MPAEERKHEGLSLQFRESIDGGAYGDTLLVGEDFVARGIDGDGRESCRSFLAIRAGSVAAHPVDCPAVSDHRDPRHHRPAGRIEASGLLPHLDVHLLSYLSGDLPVAEHPQRHAVDRSRRAVVQLGEGFAVAPRRSSEQVGQLTIPLWGSGRRARVRLGMHTGTRSFLRRPWIARTGYVRRSRASEA